MRRYKLRQRSRKKSRYLQKRHFQSTKSEDFSRHSITQQKESLQSLLKRLKRLIVGKKRKLKLKSKSPNREARSRIEINLVAINSTKVEKLKPKELMILQEE